MAVTDSIEGRLGATFDDDTAKLLRQSWDGHSSEQLDAMLTTVGFRNPPVFAANLACVAAGVADDSDDRTVLARLIEAFALAHPDAITCTIAETRFTLLSNARPDAGQRTYGTDWEQRRSEATVNWASRLLRFQDDPRLSALPPGEIDAKVSRLLRANPGANERYRHAVDPVVTRLALPRLRIVDVARFAAGHGWRRVVGLLAASGLVAGTVVAWVSPAVGAWLFAAGYVAIVAGALTFGAPFAYMFCLRMPAVAVVAQLALFTTTVWFDNVQSRRGSLLIAALAVASFGYLLLEARSHVESWQTAVARTIGVWLLAAVHALGVATIALVVAGPIYLATAQVPFVMPDGWVLASVLGFVTVAGLAAGVLLQVLWEDRPITSPLGRITWSAR